MSNPGDGDATPITSIRQLAEHIATGCKPPADWRIGTEHEKFGFRRDDLATPPYLPADGQPGSIRDLLTGMQRYDASPITDHGNIIGLKQGGAAISLEPAGQLELSGAPVETLHDTRTEMETHFAQVRSIAEDLRIDSPRSASIPWQGGPTCRGCRRAATPSCGATCRWLARAAST